MHMNVWPAVSMYVCIYVCIYLRQGLALYPSLAQSSLFTCVDQTDLKFGGDSSAFANASVSGLSHHAWLEVYLKYRRIAT